MRIETEIKRYSSRKPDAANILGRFRQLILRPKLCAVCALLGIFGGLSSLFIGLVCVLIHTIAADDHAFDRVGTVLLIAALPMILIGSIFLDEININKC